MENPNLKMGFIVCEAKRQNYRRINQKVLRVPFTLQLARFFDNLGEVYVLNLR